MPAGKGKIEPYLKIPHHILNLREIGLREKVLLAHIYSFGSRGCYQSNATLAEIFMTSPSTISRWLARIKPFVHAKNPKGYYRTLWARSHPDVRAAARADLGSPQQHKQHKSKPAQHRKYAKDPMQNRPTDCRKSAIRPYQKCSATINKTITETNRDTIGPPSPLPAGGQAPAALQSRQAHAQARIDHFTARFGSARARAATMTPQEFDRRRAQILRDLAAPTTAGKNPPRPTAGAKG